MVVNFGDENRITSEVLVSLSSMIGMFYFANVSKIFSV